MKIEVLGAGCRTCEDLYENVVTAAGELEVEYELTKVADPAYFVRMGVFVTPGLLINGKVVSVGKLLTVEQVRKAIREQM